MNALVSNQELNEEDIIKTALTGSQPLSSFIWDLEKLQTTVTQRIQLLATNYHENILLHQDSLQGLGLNIKDLLKRAENLQQRTGKLSTELETIVEKMTEGVQKLEKVQKASEIVRIAQQFLNKSKKAKLNESKDLQDLASKLRGIGIIDKITKENA